MSAAEVAERTGAHDVFILRRIEDQRLFNLDGHGRGSGWAGNITVAPGEEPMLHEAMDGRLVRKNSGVPFRVFGPYWSTSVAIVPVEHGVVVFGGGDVAGCDDAVLTAAASQVMGHVSAVPGGKREADDAELRQALEALEAMDTSTIHKAATQLAALAARSLSCEFGAVLLNGSPPQLFMADEGWRPAGTEDEVIAALLPLQQAASEGMLVEQDTAQSVFPYRPLSREDGLVARLAVPLGSDGKLGVLVVAHAGSAARGFTSLCQKVVSTLGENAGRMLEAQLASG